MGVKKNFAYNSILTVSNYIFPILTYPYITRVLGVSNIGTANFVDGVINYFILFSMLGINATGIREIAKYKSDPEKLRITYSNLFLLNTASTFFVLIFLLIVTITVPKLNAYRDLMFLGAIKLIFTLFLSEWFFRGIEDFKYITFRSLIVKIIFVISVFIFIRNSEDYKIYYALLVASVVLNAIFNTSYRRKFVRFTFNKINFKPYYKSFFTMGFYLMLTSMYTTFNVGYLGFVSGDTEVGFYTTAIKLYQILLSFFTAFTAVMLPRMSTLVAEARIEEVKKLTFKSYDALMAFSIPIIVIAIFFAPEIIKLIAGPGFEGAILPMRIIMPLVLIIGIEQILVLQLLVPLKKDKMILVNSIIGATIGILLNIFLVPSFKSIGSAIVLISSEFAVLISSQYFVTKTVGLHFPFKKITINLLFGLPIILICCVIKLSPYFSNLERLVLSTLGSGIYFILIQFFFVKNELVVKMIKDSLGLIKSQLYNKE